MIEIPEGVIEPSGAAGLLCFYKHGPEVTGVVSATRGNHGQSLAFAGRVHGLAVTIFVPHGNSVEKNSAMRSLGATVVEDGDDFQEAREVAGACQGEQVVQLDERGARPRHTG